MQCFLVVSITSSSGILARFGYEEAKHPGVYRSKYPVYDGIPILLLNDLADLPHNVFFKLFASHRRAKQAAIAGVQVWWWSSLPVAMQFFIQGLLDMWMKGVKLMDTITPEDVIEQGKRATEWLQPLIDMEEIDTILGQTAYIQRIREEGKLEMLRQGIAIRFDVPPDMFDQQLTPLDFGKLDQVSQLLFKATDISEFEIGLAEFSEHNQ